MGQYKKDETINVFLTNPSSPELDIDVEKVAPINRPLPDLPGASKANRPRRWSHRPRGARFRAEEVHQSKLAKLSSLPEAGAQPAKARSCPGAWAVRVVNGKIPIPDVRIEYETVEGEMAKVDLELATGHYHRASLAAKIQAGFSIYALPEDAARLCAAMADPEIMQEIFSL
jgi:hypothetical protein